MQESATGSFSHIPSVFLRENWHLEVCTQKVLKWSSTYEIRLVDRSYISARLIWNHKLYLDCINHRCLYSILLISCHLNVVNLLYFMEVLIERLRLQYFSFPL